MNLLNEALEILNELPNWNSIEIKNENIEKISPLKNISFDLEKFFSLQKRLYNICKCIDLCLWSEQDLEKEIKLNLISMYPFEIKRDRFIRIIELETKIYNSKNRKLTDKDIILEKFYKTIFLTIAYSCYFYCFKVNRNIVDSILTQTCRNVWLSFSDETCPIEDQESILRENQIQRLKFLGKLQ